MLMWEMAVCCLHTRVTEFPASVPCGDVSVRARRLSELHKNSLSAHSMVDTTADSKDELPDVLIVDTGEYATGFVDTG